MEGFGLWNAEFQRCVVKIPRKRNWITVCDASSLTLSSNPRTKKLSTCTINCVVVFSPFRVNNLGEAKNAQIRFVCSARKCDAHISNFPTKIVHLFRPTIFPMYLVSWCEREEKLDKEHKTTTKSFFGVVSRNFLTEASFDFECKQEEPCWKFLITFVRHRVLAQRILLEN